MPTLAADGSSALDAPKRIEIDPRDKTVAWRYSCPNGHRTVDPTNGGVWCRSCANDPSIDDPHHDALLDQKTGDPVPWSAIDWRE